MRTVEIKQGVRLRAEDVTIIEDAPAPVTPTARKAIAEARQHALDLRPPAEPPKWPWEAANPRINISLRLDLPEELHMQLVFLKGVLPNTSVVKLIREATAEKVSKLIADHMAGLKAE